MVYVHYLLSDMKIYPRWAHLTAPHRRFCMGWGGWSEFFMGISPYWTWDILYYVSYT